jgi:hypothetical protein
MRKYKALEVAVHAAPDKQISLTDPDARSMATSGKDTGMVGYNVQAAVDAKHHLIFAHEVTGAEGIRTSDLCGGAPPCQRPAPLPVLQGLIAKARGRNGACFRQRYVSHQSGHRTFFLGVGCALHCI